MIDTQADVDNTTLILSFLRICAVHVEVDLIVKVKKPSAMTQTTESVT